MRSSRHLLLGAAVVALAAPAALAQAQPPAEQHEDPGDVVVITGVGPARTGDELIASTTVLSGDDIAERISGGLGDTLEGLPGVSTTAFGPSITRVPTPRLSRSIPSVVIFSAKSPGPTLRPRSTILRILSNPIRLT